MIQWLTPVLLLALLTAPSRAEFPCTAYKGDVTFLIDESEVAKAKSTNPGIVNGVDYLNKYDVLREQMRQFSDNLNQEALNGVPVDVNMRIIAYTGLNLPGGTTNRVEAVATLDKFYPGQTNVQVTPGQLLARLQQHNGNSASTVIFPDPLLTRDGTSTGGSWTNTGLDFANSYLTPARPDRRNFVVLISAQGSFNSDRMALSKTAADSLKARGWSLFVIGVNLFSQPRLLDTNELLTNVAGNSNRFVNINSYSDLFQTLRNSIKQSAEFLCDITTTTTTTATTTTTLTTTTTTPSPATGVHPCDCALRSGTYNVPDNITCHRFWICDKKDDVYYMQQFDCGPGTLFSVSTANCVEPKDYNCPAWGGTCRVGQLRTLQPHLCCGQYWECNDGTVTRHTCPAGQYFDKSVTGCRVPANNNYCLSDPLCSAGTRACNLAPVANDPCSYSITDNPGGPLIRPCQPGSAFNRDTCVCSDVAPASCSWTVVPGVGQVDPSRDNIDCKALFHMDMSLSTNGRSLTVVNDFSNAEVPIYIDRQSTSATSGAVIFGGRAITDASSYGKISDVLFVPYFAKRSFPNSWAFSIDFRFSPLADRLEYVLVTNDNCLQCVATYRLTARRPSPTSNVWTFRFWVQTADAVGYELVDKAQAEITSTIAITSNSAWTKVVVKVQLQNPATVNTDGYNAQLSGTVSTAHPTLPSTNIQQPFSTATITSRVKHNECGLSIGQGRDGAPGSRTTVALRGEVDDFKFYDCSNVTTLA